MFNFFCSKIFSAPNVDYVEKIILWEVKKWPMNLCGLCVERKLTGFSSTNLETLEEKSILILCAYPVTGKLITKQVKKVFFSPIVCLTKWSQHYPQNRPPKRLLFLEVTYINESKWKKYSKLETPMRADEATRSCPSEKFKESCMKSLVNKLKFANKNEWVTW